MAPVNEGNDDCKKCEHFDMSLGCVNTWYDEPMKKLPPCVREVIMSQDEYRSMLK